jgi:threonine/homoserine/homoserine lactone efflux protein
VRSLPTFLAVALAVTLTPGPAFAPLALIVDRFRHALRPRLMRWLERTSGAILLVFGLRLAREAR